ncbi:AAA family ATPase [Phenylobacterium sp.]|uniref:AAA family ATPase n=1 Tax=Phenylobacterium sp. TaxID=1871053 RepID=UPI0035B1A73B
MSLTLQELEVLNFRSIRGRVVVPLDAQVILVHGENGAGKTSLLSALELALTGNVQALRRADPNFATQLLHRSTTEGSVQVRARRDGVDERFHAGLAANGIQAAEPLPVELAAFFEERAYLPQSLLGQLLQIYQESDAGMNSPLAKFVGDLLGLDRLDALEAGLKPLADVRNVRKLAPAWAEAETEKSRLERILADQRRRREEAQARLDSVVQELASLGQALDLDEEPTETTLDAFHAELDDADDEAALAKITDQRRQLESIRREADLEASKGASGDEADFPIALADTEAALERWHSAEGARVEGLRTRAATLLPSHALPADLIDFRDEALRLLRSEKAGVVDRAARARADVARLAAAGEELAVARRQLEMIDNELAQIAANSGGLSSALAELTSFITDEACPVCDRNYREVSTQPLIEHVHGKVRTLSASAQRLLNLSRSRGEQQATLEQLESEIEGLTGRQLEARELAELDRLAATIEAALAEFDALSPAITEGARLTDENVAARRALSGRQARDLSGRAARETLQQVAASAGQAPLADVETLSSAAARLAATFDESVRTLNVRLATRRAARELIAAGRSIIEQREAIQREMSADQAALESAEKALQQGQAVREQGLTIRATVDKVRSDIIRGEFNDRLNRLWRDLFVRLAPAEPFVPAFRIPQSSTQRLQPKLITEHREGGDAGGTPGAMLSAGNLNTAALTLFLALHLSVPAKLPWLILDDPVQSMDDVHIAHLAALLRTLSKEHRRQVMIAVHDRALFEYLRLELSPAYPDDSLLTVELARSARRDTICLTERLSYHEETALHQAA